jgi:2-keto-4-pentenoate hydratase
MSRRQLVPPSRRDSEFSIEDGYAVGNLLHQGLVDSGWVPVGLKLGFTNQAVWGELGLDAPFWAPIYDRTVTDRSEVSLEGLVAPRIEPEIVLGLRADLQAGSTSAEVRAAIGWAALGFEIVRLMRLQMQASMGSSSLVNIVSWALTAEADSQTSKCCFGGEAMSSRVGEVRPPSADRQRLSPGCCVCRGSRGSPLARLLRRAR